VLGGQFLMGGQRLLHAIGGFGGTVGIVIVVHGGRAEGREPTSPVQLSVLRMRPVARAIRHALRGSQVVIYRPRLRLRGWNGDDAAPVGDLTHLLDQAARDFGRLPVVLVGHSMGARAALRVAGHPMVTAVAGLASWLPPGEPVSQLAGRRVLLVHGSADRVCSAAQTWAYAERARAVGPLAAIEIRDGDHAMLHRARLWHRIAGEFTRLALGLPAGRGGPAAGGGPLPGGRGAVADAFARAATGPKADAFARAAAGPGRTVL